MADRPRRPAPDGGTILGVACMLAGVGSWWVGLTLHPAQFGLDPTVANLDLLNARTNAIVIGGALFVGGCVLAR